MKKGFWNKVFADACLYFTVAAAVIFVICLMMTTSNVYEQLFSAFRMLMLLGFCFVLSLANRLLASEKTNEFTKLLIHAVLTFSGFFLLIYKPLVDDNIYQAELASSSYVAPNIFVVFGIVAVVYSLIYGISFSIRSKENKTKNKNSEYKSVYKSSK